MKKAIVLIFLSLIGVLPGIAQTDSVTVKPAKGFSQCLFTLTVKNRNAAQKSIDEVRVEIVSADGSLWYPPTAPFQWGAELLPGDQIISFTAQVNLLAPGAQQGGFILDLNTTSIDKPVNVKWTTLSGTQEVSSGTIALICTPFQSGTIDTVTTVASVSNNDPSFNFTVFARNDLFQYPISRFTIQLQTVTGGTMRPSRIIAPAGWQVDSVTALAAYFSTTTSPIDFGSNLGGFKVNLRGNPAVNSFTFNWFTYEEGGGLLGRDTIRNVTVPGSFTSASESDSVSAAVINGCLYGMTVKNYHVANGLLPSRIRRVILWSKTPNLTFTSAPNAPANWTKVLKADSIIYTASADSTALPSGKVSTSFRFSVDAPSSSPFTIGWRTLRNLTDGLSSGDLQLQCNEQPPLTDTATLESVQECNWLIRITNQHNTPPSNLVAVQLSIPSAKGTLVATGSSLGWTKTNETSNSVRFVAPVDGAQGSNIQQSILFSLSPATPGEQIPLTWSTYDEAGLQSNTPLKSSTFSIACTPVVNLCDLISAVTLAGHDTCIHDFTVKSRRTSALTNVTFQPQDGWKIDTAIAPAGWDVQVDGNKILASYTNATGIAPDGTQSGFQLRFTAIDQADNFGVKVSTTDADTRTCDTTLSFTCQSGTSGGVHASALSSDQVTVVPNPVAHDASIQFSLQQQGRVRIALLDILGNTVKNLANEILPSGSQKITLSTDELPAGTYYIRMEMLGGIVTKKIVVAH